MSIFRKVGETLGVIRKSVSFSELLSVSQGFGTTWSNNALLKQYERSVYVFGAIGKIANYTSTIDWHLYSIINSKGETKELYDHPALDLLFRFNPVQTRSEFLRITMINKKLCGKAYWLKVRNNAGKTVELWNLRPDLVTTILDDEGMIKEYNVVTDIQKGTFETVPYDDVICIREPNPTIWYEGLSPLIPARNRVETEESATRYQRDFFRNNARPDGLLKTQASLTAQQQKEMRDRWDNSYRGKGKNSKTGILYGGLEYQQISISQREMDYIESLKFTRDDILVAFGVPKSIVTTDDVNRANAEAGIFMFLSETIKPEMQYITEVVNEFLIAPEYGQQYYLEYTDPTPENREQKLNEYDKGVDRWITRNEIRALQGLQPVEGGDALYTQFSNIPIGVENPALITEEKRKQQQEQKKAVFRGKHYARAKFQIIDAVNTKKKKKDTKQNKKKANKYQGSFLDNEEKRDKYIEVINKQIDKRVLLFIKGLNTIVEKQQAMVIEAIESEKSFNTKSYKERAAYRNKISQSAIARIFNKQVQNELVATFALPYLESFLVEAGQEALDLLGKKQQFNVTQDIKNRIDERSRFFADSINTTTFERLSAQLSEGIASGEGINQLTERVRTVYDQYDDYRLALIARTETTNANNEGFQDAYSQSGVVNGKEWIATLDDRTREEHALLDGEIVGIHNNFSNGLPYPQEPNCRCVIAPAIED